MPSSRKLFKISSSKRPIVVSYVDKRCSRKQPCKLQLSTDNFPLFHHTCDLFHETRGQNLWIQDDQVFFSANLIDDKNGKI